MRGQPKISVVTPSFNQADYLEATLRSVLSQDYDNLEYIVIDGGSTDGSRAIIESHADRLAFWESTPDGGQSEAINKGFERATGDILCWLNSDDLFAPGTLAGVAERFSAASGPMWLTGAARLIDEQGRQIGIRYPGDFDEARFLADGMDWIVQQSTFWNRPLWERAGPLNVDLHFVMDLDLWRRMLDIVPPTTTDRVLAAYRLHDLGKCVHMPERAATELRQLLRDWLLRQYRLDPVGPEDQFESLLDRVLAEYLALRDARQQADARLRRLTGHSVLGPLLRLWRRLVNPSLDLGTQESRGER